ncbi:MAG: hypothetical protein O7D91_11325 [Planctomycetota bacterium]|nr:hypothetical protein [Planctomycetota bacterium]
MLRKALTTLSLLGLLLSVGLWVLSYFHVFYESSNLHHISWISKGCVTWRIREAYFPGHQATVQVGGYKGVETTWWPSKTLGGNRLLGYRTDSLNMAIPMWLPTLLFSVWPAWRSLPLHRRRRRKMLGLCLKCGYNLRGLTKPRCPECNTSFDERLLKKDA